MKGTSVNLLGSTVSSMVEVLHLRYQRTLNRGKLGRPSFLSGLLHPFRVPGHDFTSSTEGTCHVTDRVPECLDFASSFILTTTDQLSEKVSSGLKLSSRS